MGLKKAIKLNQYTKYTTLTLNGKTYSKAALLTKVKTVELNVSTTSTWEKSLFRFISEWLDETAFVIVKTSGSTGKPKLIRLEKDKMVASAKATGHYFQLGKKTMALLCLPCDYIAGKMMVVRSFVLGMNLLTVSPSSYPLSEKLENVDFAAMIPLQVANSLAANFVQFNQIKQVIIGGGAVDSTLLQRLQKVKPICYATYGMTETITHIAVKRLNTPQATAIYQALENVQFSQDKRGCLVIDALHLSSEKVTTNDLVHLVNRYTFEWLGRYDNVINTGGIKVHPEQVEKKLAIFISCRFFIASLPHEKLGNQVILVIEGDANKSQHLLEIDFKTILSKYEIPKRIYFQSKFAETPTGKIQRQQTIQALDLLISY